MDRMSEQGISDLGKHVEHQGRVAEEVREVGRLPPHAAVPLAYKTSKHRLDHPLHRAQALGLC